MYSARTVGRREPAATSQRYFPGSLTCATRRRSHFRTKTLDMPTAQSPGPLQPCHPIGTRTGKRGTGHVHHTRHAHRHVRSVDPPHNLKRPDPRRIRRQPLRRQPQPPRETRRRRVRPGHPDSPPTHNRRRSGEPDPQTLTARHHHQRRPCPDQHRTPPALATPLKRPL